MKTATRIVALVEGILNFIAAGFCFIFGIVLAASQSLLRDMISGQYPEADEEAMAVLMAVYIVMFIVLALVLAAGGALCLVIRSKAGAEKPSRKTLIALGAVTAVLVSVPAGVLSIVYGAIYGN